jgi:hypothetical protein
MKTFSLCTFVVEKELSAESVIALFFSKVHVRGIVVFNRSLVQLTPIYLP